MKRHRHVPMSQDEQLARQNWRRSVTRYGCAMCRAFPVADEYSRMIFEPDLKRIDPHHILSQRLLKDNALGDELWNPDNGLGLCRYHHFRHENYAQRVPRDLLPPKAISFAVEHGLMWRLDVDYK